MDEQLEFNTFIYLAVNNFQQRLHCTIFVFFYPKQLFCLYFFGFFFLQSPIIQCQCCPETSEQKKKIVFLFFFCQFEINFLQFFYVFILQIQKKRKKNKRNWNQKYIIFSEANLWTFKCVHNLASLLFFNYLFANWNTF